MVIGSTAPCALSLYFHEACSVLSCIFTLDFPKPSLIRHSPCITREAQWSDSMWKMNLSHQDQDELPLQGGFPPTPLLTDLINSYFPSTQDANPEVLATCTTAPSFGGVGDAPWDISLMRDVTFQPQLGSSSTWQAADVTCPCSPWTKSTEPKKEAVKSSNCGNPATGHFSFQETNSFTYQCRGAEVGKNLKPL